MSARRLALLLTCGGVLAGVAGCDDFRPRSSGGTDPPAAPAAAAFRSDLSGDISGYYMPTAEVQAGDWLLRNAFIGQEADFAGWEVGTRRGVFAPVMFEFEDVTSPMTATELGEVRSGQIRVLPSRYEVTDGRVVFEGQADGVGVVSFSGRLDGDALATARRNLGDESPVLVGTLSVGGRKFDGVRFRWWAGD